MTDRTGRSKPARPVRLLLGAVVRRRAERSSPSSSAAAAPSRLPCSANLGRPRTSCPVVPGPVNALKNPGHRYPIGRLSVTYGADGISDTVHPRHGRAAPRLARAPPRSSAARRLGAHRRTLSVAASRLPTRVRSACVTPCQRRGRGEDSGRAGTRTGGQGRCLSRRLAAGAGECHYDAFRELEHLQLRLPMPQECMLVLHSSSH